MANVIVDPRPTMSAEYPARGESTVLRTHTSWKPRVIVPSPSPMSSSWSPTLMMK